MVLLTGADLPEEVIVSLHIICLTRLRILMLFRLVYQVECTGAFIYSNLFITKTLGTLLSCRVTKSQSKSFILN